MWIQFHHMYTLRLQRNILGKECEIWENPRFKKKNTTIQKKGKLIFNEYLVLARYFIYVISLNLHNTAMEWGLTAVPHLQIRQQESKQGGLFTGSHKVCQS